MRSFLHWILTETNWEADYSFSSLCWIRQTVSFTLYSYLTVLRVRFGNYFKIARLSIVKPNEIYSYNLTSTTKETHHAEIYLIFKILSSLLTYFIKMIEMKSKSSKFIILTIVISIYNRPGRQSSKMLFLMIFNEPMTKYTIVAQKPLACPKMWNHQKKV